METWPETLIPNSMNWKLVSNTKIFKSSFNSSVKTARFPGQMWKGTLTFKNLTRDQLTELEVFIRSLYGASGRFLLRDLKTEGSVAKGTPVVAQSDQSGSELLTKGWNNSTTILKKGAYFSINNELKQCLKDVVSNASGEATLSFFPWLRSSPSSGDSIVTHYPAGVFRLSDDDQGDFSIKPVFADVKIEVVEAFYV